MLFKLTTWTFCDRREKTDKTIQIHREIDRKRRRLWRKKRRGGWGWSPGSRNTFNFAYVVCSTDYTHPVLKYWFEFVAHCAVPLMRQICRRERDVGLWPRSSIKNCVCRFQRVLTTTNSKLEAARRYDSNESPRAKISQTLFVAVFLFSLVGQRQHHSNRSSSDHLHLLTNRSFSAFESQLIQTT